MHIFITGSSGLIGKRLVSMLKDHGHEVTKLVRSETGASDERQWDQLVESLRPEVLKGCDALVHLAGENIASGRWTEEKKRKGRVIHWPITMRRV